MVLLEVLTGKVSAMFTFGQPVQNALVAVSLVQSASVGGGPRNSASVGVGGEPRQKRRADEPAGRLCV